MKKDILFTSSLVRGKQGEDYIANFIKAHGYIVKRTEGYCHFDGIYYKKSDFDEPELWHYYDVKNQNAVSRGEIVLEITNTNNESIDGKGWFTYAVETNCVDEFFFTDCKGNVLVCSLKALSDYYEWTKNVLRKADVNGEIVYITINELVKFAPQSVKFIQNWKVN